MEKIVGGAFVTLFSENTFFTECRVTFDKQGGNVNELRFARTFAK